jgi:toxin ParE1/3/4
MRIKWSPEAIVDLMDLREYIARDNPDAAQQIALRIVGVIEVVLADNPESGHSGRVPHTREFVIPDTPVVVPYRIRNETLEILGVFHHARRWPDHF